MLEIAHSQIANNNALGGRGPDEDSLDPGFEGHGNGGGLYNRGVVTLTQTSIISNNASGLTDMPGPGRGRGGGVWNWGTLVIQQSDLISNTANRENLGGSSGQGGGLWNRGNVELQGTALQGNFAQGVNLSNEGTGGAIWNEGTITADDTTFQSNYAFSEASFDMGASARGGAIYNEGVVTLTHNLLTDNRVRGGDGLGMEAGHGEGGAIYNDGTLHLDYTAVISNRAEGGQDGMSGGSAAGGGIFSTNQVNDSSVVINHSLLSYNQTTDAGGGILVGSLTAGSDNSLFIYNSTFYRNIANDGGAIFNYASQAGRFSHVTLINSTFFENVANFGLAILNATSSGLATVNSKNSLFDNPGGDSCFNENGTFISSGHNLENGDSCNFSQSSDIVNADPRLGVFQDNGDATSVVSLLSDSPAIDAGDNAVCAAAPINGVDHLHL